MSYTVKSSKRTTVFPWKGHGTSLKFLEKQIEGIDLVLYPNKSNSKARCLHLEKTIALQTITTKETHV